MNRYLVFEGENYYPGGGWYDFVDSFPTLAEAKGRESGLFRGESHTAYRAAGWYPEHPIELNLSATSYAVVGAIPWWAIEPPEDAPPRPPAHPLGGDYFWGGEILESVEPWLDGWIHIVDLETGEIVSEFTVEGWKDPE